MANSNTGGPFTKRDTTAQLLGAYRRELLAEGVREEDVSQLVIEAARQILRDDSLHVSAVRHCNCHKCRFNPARGDQRSGCPCAMCGPSPAGSSESLSVTLAFATELLADPDGHDAIADEFRKAALAALGAWGDR